MTLLLSRSDLEQMLDVRACLEVLRQGFLAAPSAIVPQRIRTDLPGPGTATVLLPGLVPGIPAYSVKVNAKFPRSQPALRGVVCLHDSGTGELLAVLDSATVTAWRTGLSAALATHELARPEVGNVAVIGAGAQADLVLRGLAALRSWPHLTVSDLDRAAADRLIERHHTGSAGAVGSAGWAASPAEAARQAGIVILATWSREPLLDTGDVAPGSHVTSLGADEPGKAELSPGLLAAARVFVDDLPLAVTSGALGTAGLPAETAAGTLSEVLRGTIPGRRTDAERTVYTPVGLPAQDLALAWAVYQQARRAGRGHEYDFLA
ncbi:MAG TPA: ornithine cyclodeaminase family protein [Streptosporangiaceae bacterium]|nr:ornithine cyclodeaminase family protein [Streptosporangiaceae bacterium]